MKAGLFSKLLTFSIACILLLAACGGKPTQAIPLDLSASLSELQGTVEIKNQDQADFNAAANGMQLQAQGQVRTGSDGRARLDLSTGTIVRVAPGSMFTLESNTQESGSLLTRLKISAGRLWIVLRGGQMEVEAPSGVATVRGSFMSVWVDPLTDDVWVTCLEGWCKAENPTAALEMVSGEGANLYSWDPAGTTPPPPPELRYLTQDDIDQFLANNPEAQDVMNSVMATASALPTLTPIPTDTPTPTPTATPNSCVTLLTPANGTNYTGSTHVNFTWTEYPGAENYLIYFKPPENPAISFIAWSPIHSRWIESLYPGGEYQWWVTVMDNKLQDVCTSEVFTFTKPATWPQPTETPTPTPTPGGSEETGLFWNRQVSITTCSISVSVETNFSNGDVKLALSTTNPPPTDPSLGLNSGEGTVYNGAVSLYSFLGGPVSADTTIYWRFEIFDYGTETYILDDTVGSITTTTDCGPF